MKLKFLSIILISVLAIQSSFAVNSVGKSLPTNGIERQISMVESKTLSKAEARSIAKEERKQAKVQKRVAMVQKMMTKNMANKAVDFHDPVNKWLWFAVFGWGASIVLWILAAALITGGYGIIGLLASLAALFGTVAFVIWLVKKFGDA
ncbi:MAG: hypothetical protein ABI844_14625 [Saprospiraceae bacterium]